MAEVKFAPPPLGTPSRCRAFMLGTSQRFVLNDLERFAVRWVQYDGPATIYPDMAQQAEEELAEGLRYWLSNNGFNPERDYLVVLGDMLILSVLMFVLHDMVDKVCLLRYDSAARAYWPFMVWGAKHKGER